MFLRVIFLYSVLLFYIGDISALTEDAAICEIASQFLKYHQFASGWSCIENAPVIDICNGETSDWEGIICSAGNVAALLLPKYNISGNIPTAIGYLTNLRSLDLSRNYFAGTLPSTLCNLSNLNYLSLYSNSLSGTLSSCIGKLQKLNYLYLYANYFVGSLPSSIGFLTNMYEIYLQYPLYYPYNKFTGTLPASIGFLTTLTTISFHNSYFSGTIPQSISNLTNLQHLWLYNNDLTGSIPNKIGQLANLKNFIVSSNRLSGNIPTSIARLTNLTTFTVGHNSLTGSIPSTLGNLKKLSVLFLNYNHLNGTIPPSIGLLSSLINYEIGHNHLTGSIPTTIGYLTRLQGLSLGSNSLTGSLPASLGNLIKLTVLDLSVNSLSNAIPNSLQRLNKIQGLYLRNNRLSGQFSSFINTTTWIQLINIDVSNNYITGTLPSGSFFNNSKLLIFAATDNCIKAIIPSTVCHAQNLKILALDGLTSANKCPRASYHLSKHLSRTIPSCLLGMPALMVLHLSGNALTGTLHNTATLGPALQDLTLSYNRLEGNIPLQIQARTWTTLDLSYNSFSGTLSHEMIVNQASYFSLKVNRLSGIIPPGLREAMNNLTILQGNIFECDLDTSALPRHDEGRCRYLCGSDAFQLALVVFVGVFLLSLLLGRLIAGEEYSLNQIYFLLFLDSRSQYSYGLVRTLSHFYLAATLFAVCILIPVYAILNSKYGTYTFKYGWSISVAYLAGNGAAETLIVMWTLLTVGLLWGFGLRLCHWQPRRQQQREIVMTETQRNVLLESVEIPVITITTIMLTALPPAPPPATITTPPSFPSVRATNVPIMEEVSAVDVIPISSTCYKLTTVLVLLENAVLMFGMNIIYVLLVQKARSTWSVVLLQLLMGLYNVSWGNVVCRTLLGYFLAAHHEIAFISMILIFNNICQPLLAELLLDPNCLFGPDPVTTSYSYTICEGRVDGLCGGQEHITAAVTFAPPFLYRHQCSALVLTNYVPVFTYTFLFHAIQIPMSSIFVRFRNLFRKSSRVFKCLNGFCHSLHKTPTSFFITIYLATMMSNIAILLTFGIVYPPLAVLILLSVISDAYFTMQQIDRLQPMIYDRIVGMQTLSLLPALLTISAVFLACYLFDISQALWAPLVLVGMSMGTHALVYLTDYLKKRNN